MTGYKYQAETMSEFRKWGMKSPLFNTHGEALKWILDKRKICQAQEGTLKVFKNAYISRYNEGEKISVEKLGVNALGMLIPLNLTLTKRKAA